MATGSSRAPSPRRLAAWGGGGALAAAAVLMLWWGHRRPSHAGTSAPTSSGAPAAKRGDDPAQPVALPPSARSNNPLATEVVARTRIDPDLELVGSVAFDEDRYALVGPPIAGRVIRLLVAPGEQVRRGRVLAEIDSAEVGRAQADLLVARARARLSRANLKRERSLAAERVSSTRDRELAEAQAATDAAEVRAAEQRLAALGLGQREVGASDWKHAGRLPLRSPIDGVVLQREVTIGQAVEAHTEAFRVADLSRLWVQLDVYEKDLEHVHRDQRVVLRTESLPGARFEARVAWVDPRIDETTRSARVRIEFDNHEGHLRPGQFVTARLTGGGGTVDAALALPRSAVVSIDGRSAVFVSTSGDRWLRRNVELGRAGGGLIEIRSGLVGGERVVTNGAFLLKSALAR